MRSVVKALALDVVDSDGDKLDSWNRDSGSYASMRICSQCSLDISRWQRQHEV